jgi:hypothetical protein
VRQEVPIYARLKFENSINWHFEVEHGTPPLRVFESRVSGVLDSRFLLSQNSPFQLPFLSVWGPVFQSRTLAEPTTMATSPTNHDPHHAYF